MAQQKYRSIGGYNLIVIMHTSNKDFQQVHAEGLQDN